MTLNGPRTIINAKTILTNSYKDITLCVVTCIIVIPGSLYYGLTLSPGGPGGPSLPAVPCNTNATAENPHQLIFRQEQQKTMLDRALPSKKKA